jgi:hypothetical protein
MTVFELQTALEALDDGALAEAGLELDGPIIALLETLRRHPALHRAFSQQRDLASRLEAVLAVGYPATPFGERLITIARNLNAQPILG